MVASQMHIISKVLGWQKFPECPHMVGSGTDHWLHPAKAGGWGFSIRVSPHGSLSFVITWQQGPSERHSRSGRQKLQTSQGQPQNFTASFPPCSVGKKSPGASSLNSKEVERVCLLMWKRWGQTAKSSMEWEMWFINHLCKYLGMLGWGECVLCVRRTWIWGRLDEREWTVCLPRLTCWSSNPQYLRMNPYLETRSLQI